jgi:uncharacterized protein with HEPN domain
VSRDARDYLVDLHRHAVIAAEIIAGRSVDDLATDHIAVLALERAIEIVGEAASKLPAPLKEKCPDLPGREMIGMRHRLAHAYFGRDLAILHEVATHRLPTLVPILARMIDAEDGSAG